MPIRKKKGESKSDFMSRCMAKEIKAGKKKDQAAAICNSTWKEFSLKEFKQIRQPEFDYQQWAIDFFDNNEDVGGNIKDLGLTEEDFTEEYKMELTEEDFNIDEHSFNVEKFEEGDEFMTVYRYETTKAGHKAERPFCQRLMNYMKAGGYYKKEDIFLMNTWSGKADRSGGKPYSVFKYRGGNNCLHKWVRYKYNMTRARLEKPTFVQPKMPRLR